MSIILVIDDDNEERTKLAELLENKLTGTTVLPFEGKEKLCKDASYEDHISKWIENSCDNDSIDLIVCDKELGKYHELRGLSANPVAAVALQKGIPFCQYSRQADPKSRDFARFRRLRQWSSEQITLDGNSASDWAPQVKCLYDGFECIRNKYIELVKTTPAGTLANILSHPESESKIALYGSGDQGFLQEIMTFYDPETSNVDELHARMPRVLGSWLFLSILRFPGILVNQTAAASYLNIALDDYGKPEVQSLFDTAKYSGPFYDHDPLGPWWWRDELDNIIGEAGFEDGNVYANSRSCDVKDCLDPDTNDKAGYYCMMTQKPVSSKNSRGNISWFPAGADLARIQKDKYEAITALIGMY